MFRRYSLLSLLISSREIKLIGVEFEVTFDDICAARAPELSERRLSDVTLEKVIEILAQHMNKVPALARYLKSPNTC